MNETENIAMQLNLWKKIRKKNKDKPPAVKLLANRTTNTAFAVIDKITDIDFAKLSMSLYFYTQDVLMKQFTHLYEAQLELAGANPERFVLQLHSFFNDISNKIRKQDLYNDFFEFYYRCVKLRYTLSSDRIEKKVVFAYLDLLTQTFEYLRPNKFDFNTIVAGRKTTGELMTTPDHFPNVDAPGYLIQEDMDNGTLTAETYEGRFMGYYRQYGFDVHTMEDVQKVVSRDNLATVTVLNLLPFINEFTYDIIPTNPFSALASPFDLLDTDIELKTLKEKLTHRKNTLPSNGVVTTFKNPVMFKSLLLKEVFYDNSIFVLFKIDTQEGELAGFYDTKSKYFFSVLNDYDENPFCVANFTTLILYIYGCYTLNDPDIQLSSLGSHFKYATLALEAEGYLQGGKLKNMYDPDKEVSIGTARKGNDAFTTEAKAIQGFIRRVPEGKKPSQEAIDLAVSLGYVLEPNETYVRPFIKQVFKLKEKTDIGE